MSQPTQSDLFHVGDIVLAVKPQFAFESYEGTVMYASAHVVHVKWVYDDKGDTFEYGPNELKLYS